MKSGFRFQRVLIIELKIGDFNFKGDDFTAFKDFKDFEDFRDLNFN